MKLLVILPRVPWPLEKGDKLRAYHMLRHLSKDFEITLVALNDEGNKRDAIPHLQPYCQHIEIIRLYKPMIYLRLIRCFLFGSLPLQVQWFLDGKAKKKIRRLIASTQPDRIFCQLIRTSEYVRDIPDIPKVLDYMDVFSKGMDRRAQTAPAYQKPVLHMEYKRLLKYEHNVFSDFQAHMIISSQDRNLIVHPDKHSIHVVPNGVDTEFFHPMQAAKDYDVLFNGNMSYPPNVESAEFLVNEVLPLLKETRPDLKILISGATPSPRVKQLAGTSVTVTGWVEDIRESFARSKMLVAPMQLSIGLQNKLLEAMSMKIPCITSPLANNALQAPEGSCILVAADAPAYARHILHLLDHPEQAERMAEEAYAFIRQKFRWEAVAQEVAQVIRQARTP